MSKYGNGITIETMEECVLHGCDNEPGVVEMLKDHKLRSKDKDFVESLAAKYDMDDQDRRMLMHLIKRLSVTKDERKFIVHCIKEAFYQWRSSNEVSLSFERCQKDIFGREAYAVLLKHYMQSLSNRENMTETREEFLAAMGKEIGHIITDVEDETDNIDETPTQETLSKDPAIVHVKYLPEEERVRKVFIVSKEAAEAWTDFVKDVPYRTQVTDAALLRFIEDCKAGLVKIINDETQVSCNVQENNEDVNEELKEAETQTIQAE